MELNQLVKALEEEFGVSAAAPVAVAAAPAAGEAAPAAEEKTEFNVVLKEIGANKLAVVKAVKEATGLGLVEAKKLVEDKGVIKENATKEELMRVKSGDKAACDNGQYLDSVIGSINTATIAGKNANLLIANKHYLCQFTANYEAVKGEIVIDKAISYTPDNGMQQLFIMITR
jgi:large subunit ribosomal protein L7/L12